MHNWSTIYYTALYYIAPFVGSLHKVTGRCSVHIADIDLCPTNTVCLTELCRRNTVCLTELCRRNTVCLTELCRRNTVLPNCLQKLHSRSLHIELPKWWYRSVLQRQLGVKRVSMCGLGLSVKAFAKCFNLSNGVVEISMDSLFQEYLCIYHLKQ
jgi:hypothetical protein